MQPFGVRVSIALSTLILIPVVAVIVAPQAQAARACTSAPKTSYFAGSTTAYSVSIFGASALIEYNNPDLCGSDADGSGLSSAWSMVTAHSASHPTNFNYEAYAQSGYLQAGKGTGYPNKIVTFSQYRRRCGVDSDNCGGEATFNSAYWIAPNENFWTYTSRYEIGSGHDNHIHMYAHGHQVDETNYDPAGDWATAWSCQYEGETHELASDVPGTSSDVTAFSHIKYVDDNLGYHFVGVYTPSADGTRYHAVRYTPSDGGQGIKIWTNPK